MSARVVHNDGYRRIVLPDDPKEYVTVEYSSRDAMGVEIWVAEEHDNIARMLMTKLARALVASEAKP